MNVVWLASYPKSGNTWLATMLFIYIYKPVDTSGEIVERIPDIHDLNAEGQSLNEASSETILCKTHSLFGPQHPHAENTAAFIYLMRNPKDILLSGSNFHKLFIQDIQQFDEQSYAASFIQHMGDITWSKRGFGNWPEHGGNWMMQCGRFPHLFLTYEGMKTEPEKNLTRVAKFLNLEVDEEKIARTVKQSSFSSMRKMEENDRSQGLTNTMFAANANKDVFFVNKGKSGQSLSHIGKGYDHAFNMRFRESGAMFGYNF